MRFDFQDFLMFAGMALAGVGLWIEFMWRGMIILGAAIFVLGFVADLARKTPGENDVHKRGE